MGFKIKTILTYKISIRKSSKVWLFPWWLFRCFLKNFQILSPELLQGFPLLCWCLENMFIYRVIQHCLWLLHFFPTSQPLPRITFLLINPRSHDPSLLTAFLPKSSTPFPHILVLTQNPSNSPPNIGYIEFEVTFHFQVEMLNRQSNIKVWDPE